MENEKLNTDVEIIHSEEIDSSIVYNQDKAFIDTQISTAKAYPRNIKRSVENALAIVTMDKETAATCTYSVPRGGRAITGASVHLAKILAQVWGNLRVDAKVVSIDAKTITSEAVCFDLETNLAIKTQVKRSIMGKTGRFNDDMITVTGNAANAIALRNAVLSVIPRAVVDKVYNAAKQTITGDVSDKNKLIAKRKQVFEGLKDTYGLTETEVLFAIGKAAIDHVTGDDLVVLIGIGQAIKDGDTTVESAFRGKGTNKPDVNHEQERKKGLIKECGTPDDLTALLSQIDLDEELTLYFEERMKELKKKKS